MDNIIQFLPKDIGEIRDESAVAEIQGEPPKQQSFEVRLWIRSLNPIPIDFQNLVIECLTDRCDSFYEISKNMSNHKKGVGMGRGKKISFGDPNRFPSPNNYMIKSMFHGKDKGVRMSLGREKIKYGGIFVKSDTPDPGSYNTCLQKRAPEYSFRAKLKPLAQTCDKQLGPGQYKCPSTISATGIYVLSNLRNCAAPKIKPSKIYDPNNNMKTPSPCQYMLDKQNMNGNGNFYNSKFEGSRCRSFSRSSKGEDSGLKIKSKVPGPGQYDYYSEFGARR